MVSNLGVGVVSLRFGETITVCSESSDETRRYGRELGEVLCGGVAIGLTGELGAGKTEFVRGFVTALGIKEQISSPSFVLEAEYDVGSAYLKRTGVRTLHHWDLFRLPVSVGVIEELKEYCTDSSRIVVVEWPERGEWLQNLLSIQITINSPRPEEMHIEEIERREIHIQYR